VTATWAAGREKPARRAAAAAVGALHLRSPTCIPQDVLERSVARRLHGANFRRAAARVARTRRPGEVGRRGSARGMRKVPDDLSLEGRVPDIDRSCRDCPWRAGAGQSPQFIERIDGRRLSAARVVSVVPDRVLRLLEVSAPRSRVAESLLGNCRRTRCSGGVGTGVKAGSTGRQGRGSGRCRRRVGACLRRPLVTTLATQTRMLASARRAR